MANRYILKYNLLLETAILWVKQIFIPEGKIFLPIWFAPQTTFIKRSSKFFTLFLILIIFCNSILRAQVTISGTIVDQNGKPVIGANIFIDGTAEGSSSNTIGHFNFITNQKGLQNLSVSSIGYKLYSKQILTDSLISDLHIELKIDQASLGEVVVSAGSFQASDKAKGANLHPIDVVTTAGNNGDIANALKTLPGTQQIGEQEGLFVRGGTSDETKQFIDGTILYNPNFPSIPGIIQPAHLSPFLFNGINFSSGGYSALYGGGMSGALILESVDLPEKSSSVIGGGPIVGTAGFQNLSANNKCSYGINARYVNYYVYSQVIPQTPDYFHGPEFVSIDGDFRIKTSKTGILKFYSNVSYTNTGMINPDVDSLNLKSKFQVKGENIYNVLSYRELINEKWKVDFSATYNYSDNNFINNLLNSNNEQISIPSYPFDRQNSNTEVVSDFVNAKAVITNYCSHSITLRFGGEYTFSNDNYNYSDSTINIKDNLFATFLESDIKLTSKIAAKIGVRYENSLLFNRSDIAPRISMAYRFNDAGQINIAYGLFYQEPNYNAVYSSIFQDNTIITNSPSFLQQYKDLTFSYAAHYIINYTKKANNRLFRIEAYYKQYYDLIKTYPVLNNNGSGYARGVELFWRDKKTINNLDYWITYTFIDTKREYLDYPGQLKPTFATPNSFSIVAKRYFENLNTSFNAAYSFATGRPYYDIRTNNTTQGPQIYDQGTTPAYNSLNLSISYLLTFFKKWKNKDFSIIAFGVNNVLGSNQVFGYSYSYNGDNRMAITLPAKRNFFIGLFMTFGTNRTNDLMNENL